MQVLFVEHAFLRNLWHDHDCLNKFLMDKRCLSETHLLGNIIGAMLEWKYNTVEPLFYDHPQNQIGVVVKQGWSSMRGLIILQHVDSGTY